MNNEKQRMKSIKVSEEVHKVLSTRKHGGESFDQVLERELGLVPRTVEEFTRVLPDLLKTAVNTLKHEHIIIDGRYKRLWSKDEEKLALEFVSQETNKSIFKIVIFLPNPPERVNHRVDISYRNLQNEIERIARLRDTEDNAVNIKFTEFDTKDKKENTRRGNNAGEKTANELVGEHVQKFVNQSYEVWGQSTGPQGRS